MKIMKGGCAFVEDVDQRITVDEGEISGGFQNGCSPEVSLR